jgi:hypothetical protein
VSARLAGARPYPPAERLSALPECRLESAAAGDGKPTVCEDHGRCALSRCTSSPDRYQHATVISEHATAEDAFATLARMTERLHQHGVSIDGFDWLVVDAERRPVRGH